GDPVVLQIADEGHPGLARALERHAEELGAALVTMDETIDVAGRHRDVDRLGAAVQDGRNLAGAPQALGVGLAHALALPDDQLAHFHARLLLGSDFDFLTAPSPTIARCFGVKVRPR